MHRFLRILFALLATALLAACQPMATRHSGAGAGTDVAAAKGSASTAQSRTQRVPNVAFVLAQGQPAKNLTKVELSDNKAIYVLPVAVLSRNELSEVQTGTNKKGQFFVVFTFTKEGAKKLAQISWHNVGKSLALIINGKLVAAPRMTHPLAGGVLGIPVASRQEAQNIANAVVGRPSTPTKAAR